MFTIEVTDNGVNSALNSLLGRLGNIQPQLQYLGEMIMERTKERFATSTGPDGVAWAPNKPSTIARKGAGKKPLIGHSGDLRREFHVHSDNISVTIGSAMKYAAIHQFGGSIQRAAFSMQVRHRADANGNLMTTKHFNGKGLIFAKDRDKQAVTRWFEVAAHAINIPARPFLPVKQNGDLYPDDQAKIVDTLNAYLSGK